jgi:hypothetical protein
VTPRRKARALSALGAAICFLATAHSVFWGCWWWAKLINLTMFGMTCVVAGVVWWTTWREQRDEERIDARLRELERLRSGR